MTRPWPPEGMAHCDMSCRFTPPNNYYVNAFMGEIGSPVLSHDDSKVVATWRWPGLTRCAEVIRFVAFYPKLMRHPEIRLRVRYWDMSNRQIWSCMDKMDEDRILSECGEWFDPSQDGSQNLLSEAISMANKPLHPLFKGHFTWFLRRPLPASKPST